jgi:hypothetical protein
MWFICLAQAGKGVAVQRIIVQKLSYWFIGTGGAHLGSHRVVIIITKML